jgi:hypothetical protein
MVTDTTAVAIQIVRKARTSRPGLFGQNDCNAAASIASSLSD